MALLALHSSFCIAPRCSFVNPSFPRSYDDRPAHDDRHVNSVNSAFGGLYLGKGGSPPDERGRDGMGSPLFQVSARVPRSAL